jgi:hypothetical protein
VGPPLAARRSPPRHVKTARAGDPGPRRKEGNSFQSCWHDFAGFARGASRQAERSSRLFLLTLSQKPRKDGPRIIKGRPFLSSLGVLRHQLQRKGIPSSREKCCLLTLPFIEPAQQPFRKSDWRVLKYGSEFDGKLAIAVFAFPVFLSIEIPVLFVATGGTLRAIRPAHRSYGTNAGLLVTVEKDCLLKGLNR